MTQLPETDAPPLNLRPKPEEGNFKHPWMYSFMPIKDEIFLVGYCKQCNNSFSERVPNNPNAPVMTKMDFPKWNCVVVEF